MSERSIESFEERRRSCCELRGWGTKEAPARNRERKRERERESGVVS
jgi:hypothetical protein